MLPEINSVARRIILEAEQFTIIDGVLYHLFQQRVKGIGQVKPIIRQLAVPVSLRAQVLDACDDQLAHPGLERCYLNLRSRFFWKRKYADMLTYVTSFATCQRCKRPHAATKAPLHPLPIEEAFEKWHVDYAGPLPVSPNGNRYIFCFTDSLTKYPEMFAVKDQSATTVADILYNHIFTRYGPTRALMSDRGRNFMSTIVSELCKRFNVKRVLTSSFQPQSNSQIERHWSFVWQSLRTYCLQQQDWEKFIPAILYTHRATSSASTQWSPSFLAIGKDIQLPLQSALLPPATGKLNVHAYIRQLIPRLEISRKIAQENIATAQASYKKSYDATQNPAVYEPGTYVWLFNPYNPKGICPKLRRKYQGPYYIVKKGPNDTYYLRDATTNKAQQSPIHVGP